VSTYLNITVYDITYLNNQYVHYIGIHYYSLLIMKNICIASLGMKYTYPQQSLLITIYSNVLSS